RFCRSSRRIVNQHHENLAAIIFRRPFVVIPLLLWSVDSITDEHQLSIYVDVLSLRASERDEVVSKLKRFASLRAVDAQLSFRIRLNAHQRDWLLETSFRTRAFQPHRFKLLGNVHSCEFTATSAR